MNERDTDTEGTPRWVKVFGAVALVAVVVLVIVLVLGRGGHGPGRHTQVGDGAPSAEARDDGPATGARTPP